MYLIRKLIARVTAASGGEGTFDPTVPAEKQIVTYQTKDGRIKTVTKAELQEQMEASEKLMQSLNETWEEKLQRTHEVQKEREKALEELGITVENITDPSFFDQMPHLVNLVRIPFYFPKPCIRLTALQNEGQLEIFCVTSLGLIVACVRSVDERMSYISNKTRDHYGE